MLKKKILRASLVALFISMFYVSGCGGAEQPAKKEKTEVSLWYYWSLPNNQKHLSQLVKSFNNFQDEVEIVMKYIPDEDFKKQLALSVVDNNMPDLTLVDSADFQFFSNMQSFVDLTDQVPELKHYMEKAVEPCRIDGRYYGVPFGVNCTLLFYNKNMLKKAGCEVPRTWEEFYDAAKKIAETENKFAFAITALQSEESLYQFLPILWSMGGDVSHIDSPESMNAFQMLRSLQEAGILSKQSISLTTRDIMNQFIEENIAMMFNTPESVDTIRDNNPELNFDITYMPSNGEPVSAAGGEIFAVTPGEHQEEAIQFLNYIADTNRMKNYINYYSVLAPRMDILREQYVDDPVKSKFADIYETARLREISSEWPKLSYVVAEALSQSIIGERPVEEILAEAAAEIAEVKKEQEEQ